jgi:hypothetical protein
VKTRIRRLLSHSTLDRYSEEYSKTSEADPSSGPPPYLRTWNFYDDVPELLVGLALFTHVILQTTRQVTMYA